MVQRKIALDETAKKYWSEYFGEYGKAWVRDIPMRVKAALDSSSERKAAKTAEWEVLPFGHRITADRVTLEGAMRSADSAKVFCVEFDHDGVVKSASFVDAPL